MKMAAPWAWTASTTRSHASRCVAVAMPGCPLRHWLCSASMYVASVRALGLHQPPTTARQLFVIGHDPSCDVAILRGADSRHRRDDGPILQRDGSERDRREQVHVLDHGSDGLTAWIEVLFRRTA